MGTRRSPLALVLALTVATGCALPPARTASLANDTARTVVLVVNGEEEAVVLPHRSVTIPASRLDAGDWFVEARLDHVTGPTMLRVWMLAPGSTQDMGPAGMTHVDRGVVGLTCGSIAIWTGTRPVETPGPGTAGDCTD